MRLEEDENNEREVGCDQTEQMSVSHKHLIEMTQNLCEYDKPL